jgi:hypothetical protein
MSHLVDAVWKEEAWREKVGKEKEKKLDPPPSKGRGN